jgi:hypothetical protein
MFVKFPRVVAIAIVGVLLPTAVFVNESSAATKLIPVTPLSLISKVDASESPTGMLVRHQKIFLFGTFSGFATTDGYVQALDENGTELWKVALDSGGNDVVTAGAIDQNGNIWIAGSTAAPLAEPETTPTPYSTALNPDSVTVVSEIPHRNDTNFLSLWLISPAGNLLATYSTNLKRAIFVRGITVSSTQVSIAGIASTALGIAGFLIQSDLHGVFGKIALIGKSNTEIDGIAKENGNIILVGRSGEKLFSKPVAGFRDGIILVFSSTGKFLNIVRSFNDQSNRTWRYATSTNFLGGSAVTGSKSEAVVTKYSSKMVPMWSTRFLSGGSAQTVDISPTSHVAIFASIAPIAGIRGWNPTRAQLIALVFDNTGLISGAYRASGMSDPVASGYSRELGLVLLARGTLGVSIFHSLTL